MFFGSKLFDVQFYLPLSGVAEGMSTKAVAPKSVKKKKPEFVRRRSTDGFSMLLSYQSRLEKLYNQTLRTQVQLDVIFASVFFTWNVSSHAVS